MATYNSTYTRTTTPQTAPPVDTTWTEGVQKPLEAQQQLQSTRKSIVDMMQTVNELYAEAINKGREKEAFDLSDAAERLARSGSEIGVSAWARQQTVQDLANKMRAAAAVSENQMLIARTNANAASLNTLKNLDEQSFRNAFDVQKWLADQNRTQQLDEERRTVNAEATAQPSGVQQAQQNYFAERVQKSQVPVARPATTRPRPAASAYNPMDAWAKQQEAIMAGWGPAKVGLGKTPTEKKPYSWGEPVGPNVTWR
jgi:ribosome-binding protein aMBF1 (putative translation factor)